MLLLLYLNLYFLIPAVIAQIFNPIRELVIPLGIPIKEVKPKIEIHPVIVEAKIGFYKPFCAFLLINSFRFVSSIKQFLVSSIFFSLNS